MFKKEKVSSFVETHIPLLCFFVFILLSFVALLFFQSKALKEMRHRNECILAHYEQVLSITANQEAKETIDIVRYINEFDMTPSQGRAFLDYTYKVVEAAVAQSKVDIEVNTMVKARAESMYQETKDLLELQFAKIQHETESLQIWCGILTVVFLIFSFYSLFKTDELVQQGRDGLRELAALQASGAKRIDDLKKDGEKKIKEFETSSKEAISNAKMEKKKIVETVSSVVKSSQEKIDSQYVSLTEGLDKKYQDLAEALETRYLELENRESEKGNDLLMQFISRIENLDLRLQEVERNTK